MSKALFKSTFVVSSMTLISRVFGYVRDMVTAQIFGAGPAFDAFAVAFKIPNFIRRLSAEGSFSQAFVPVLSEYQKQKSPEEIKAFINNMAGGLGTALLILTIVGVIFAPWVVRIFAPGFDVTGPRYEMAVSMLRITFPYIFLISLTAYAGAILNTYGRYWVAAFTPVLLNLAMIAAAIWLSPLLHIPIIGLAWGVFIAGVIQLLFQFPYLQRMGLLPIPTFNFRDPGVNKVLKLMVPSLFGVSVSQINLLIDTLFASILIVGSMSWLYYSDRLLEFPLGVIGVAISTVILPHLSRHHATDSTENFSQTLDWAMRCVLLVGIPATVGVILLAGPLLSTLFQHGKFDGHAVIMASKSLVAFAIGLTAFMLVKILAAGFYAKQDIRTPVKIGILAMVANMVFNAILVWPLAHAGIALSTSLSAILNASLLFYFLLKKEIYTPRAGWGFFSIRLFAANAVLAVALWFSMGSWQEWLVHNWVWRGVHLLTILVIAAIIYFIALWIVGLRLQDLLMKQDQQADV